MKLESKICNTKTPAWDLESRGILWGLRGIAIRIAWGFCRHCEQNFRNRNGLPFRADIAIKRTDSMLTHINAHKNPTMVDVSEKGATKREARASGTITMNDAAFSAYQNNTNAKGSVLDTAIVAAIMGAKKTSDIIPMCHPLFLSKVDCEARVDAENRAITLIVVVKCEGKTGVEMEALSAVSVGLLTIYDMLKALDKTMIISDIKLLSKSGGKSGDFRA